MPRRLPTLELPGPERVNQLYGLEPVLEPGMVDGLTGTEPVVAVTISCPYCGEAFGTLVDLSAGSNTSIEDCQVCCQPIELHLSVDANGGLRSLEAQRTD